MQSFAKRIRACRGYRFFVTIPQALPAVAKELGYCEAHSVVGKATDIKVKI